MSEFNESTEYTNLFDEDVGKNRYSHSFTAVDRGAKSASAAEGVGSGDWRYQAVEFAKGAAEMSVQFGKGVRDVVKQSILREDSVIVRKLKGPCERICGKLGFLNEYLPEDRDPLHSWSVIICVWVLALAVLIVNTDHDTTTSLVKKIKIHPPSASLILLPCGRRLAYQEQGVPAEQARFSMIVPHPFLLSRLAGIPGLKHSLLQNFGVRMVTYDLPGFGESDPHPDRNLETSALDILHLSYALNITDKFWVVGYSDGSMHAWAALRYIPDRLAGAIMVAPMVNPYELRMTKEERRRIWGKWTIKKKLSYQLARKFPRLLPYFYRKSFLSGKHGQIDRWLSLSLGSRDRALVEGQMFEEFWQRNVEESVRQANVKPFVEEAVLQVSNWDFSIVDLKVPNKHQGKGILLWLKSLYSREEERSSGFLGPIHVWQGAEDLVVPPSMSDFVHRVLPDSMLHKLLYEGHFTYFFFCDECHRHMFTTVFGNPQGPLPPKVDQTPIEDVEKNSEEVIFRDTSTEEEHVSCLTTDVNEQQTHFDA
ncbi:hydrolase acyltransferase (alpha beta hydrolase superfamily) [Olea europaea subsp. europaea]|uniref:Hydrolase acyltransferase (Alpha beta hydrolase superfamily) n=1 Tax=Olea europaea subsp. europaea TaxID=158383 RepID=A0A8S0TXL6_OLEEU|nr:hydrolase acyltransferase (alpha beta hydrolase superfamily) [Olea europaea subsp. europaea]CAA3009607.1 hydrolase acyltransferase (alpha beta hydrolase superfamily) [Olea europaea subsp. europaea]